MFEKVVGELLMWGGPEKLIFSDGSMVFHSQPVLERIAKLELRDEIFERRESTVGARSRSDSSSAATTPASPATTSTT